MNQAKGGSHLKPVKDGNSHTVCFVDESTGYVEAAYKKQTTSTYLSIGDSFVIERGDAKTILTRVSDSRIRVERCRITA